MTVREKAPAKINIGLKITGKRIDGYHDILSIFQNIDLCDELEISSEHGKTTMQCSSPDIPTGPDNLVMKAELMLRKRCPDLPPVHFMLEKNIPVGAGLGGGSSDAGAALRGLRTYHHLSITDDILREVSLEIGSDVPFMVSGGTAIVSGRGEVISLVEWPFDFTYILVYPGFEVSTKWAYGRLGKINPDVAAYRESINRLRSNTSLEAAVFSDGLENDFEPVVFSEYSVLREIKEIMEDCGALKGLLSGSGSTMIGIFTDAGKARVCVSFLRKHQWETRIAHAYCCVKK